MITNELVNELEFDIIAEKILNSYEIIIKDIPYRLCEIEIYCKCEKHDDKYTHCAKEQAEYEKFYFHRHRNGTYKSGTYKGLDITFGNNDMYYGVLIRSIYNEKNNEIIEGPCRTVNKILELNGHSEVKNFVVNGTLNIYEDNRLKIRFNNNLKFQSIYAGPRIGLSDKYPEYMKRKYRYIIYKDKIKKDKKNLELMI